MHEHREVLEARYANLVDENVKRLANWPATGAVGTNAIPKRRL
jgi:hypothetical protein